jgi:ADP-ribosylglycohydrolase
MEFRDRLTGVLLGTALGDALGLVCAGMSARRVQVLAIGSNTSTRLWASKSPLAQPPMT